MPFLGNGLYPMETARVLIVDGLHRSGLAIARALKMAANYSVHVIAPSEGPLDMIRSKLKSKSIDRIDFVESLFSRAAFLDEVVGAIKTHGINVLIPAGQRAALWVSRTKRELSDCCHALVEDYEKIIKFHDKSEAVRLARDLNIPVPLTILLEDVKEIESHKGGLTYPLVIKGRKGTGATGIWYARDVKELMSVLETLSDRTMVGDGFLYDNSNPILQEYIPGEVHDVTAFCVRGKMKAGLTQKRILTRPTRGGPGVVNITTRHEALLDYASRIIDFTKWHGVCQVEFKMDERDGQPKFLEVNPRFWGTTWLTVCAGLNYPHYLVKQALGEASDLPQDYRVDLMGRWLMDELATVFGKPRTSSLMLKRAGAFVSRFRYRDCVYDLSLSDINPCVDQVVKGFYNLYEALRRRHGELRGLQC